MVFRFCNNIIGASNKICIEYVHTYICSATLYNFWLTYGDFWIHKLNFSANIKIFPGPNSSWPPAGQVKSEKNPMAFMLYIGYLSALGSGDMGLKNDLVMAIFEYLFWTLVPILEFFLVLIVHGPQLDKSNQKKTQWPLCYT